MGPCVMDGLCPKLKSQLAAEDTHRPEGDTIQSSSDADGLGRQGGLFFPALFRGLILYEERRCDAERQ